MKKIIMLILVAVITFTTVNTGLSDSKKRHYLQSVFDCERIDCKKAYTKFIKENNPGLSSKDRSEILTAVKHYTPRYFGEEPEIGMDITLAIMAVESSFQPDVMGDGGDSYKLMQIQLETAEEAARYNGIAYDYDLRNMWHNIHLGMANMNMLHERYEGYWPHAVIAYNMGYPTVDKLIKSYNIVNYTHYWEKVKDKKNRLDNIKKEVYYES